MPRLAADPRIHRLEVGLPPQAPAGLVPGVPTFTWPLDDARRGYRGLKTGLARLDPDVLFIPTARWLDAGGVPTVVMVRNMEPLTVPFAGNTVLEGVRNLARARAARVACRRATRVLAVSEHVRDFLALRWNLTPEKIGVVYHGVEPPAAGAAPVSPGRPGRVGVRAVPLHRGLDPARAGARRRHPGPGAPARRPPAAAPGHRRSAGPGDPAVPATDDRSRRKLSGQPDAWCGPGSRRRRKWPGASGVARPS